MRKTPILAFIGALLGIPLSYYFQPEIVRAKLSLSEYLTHLPEIVTDESGAYIAPVILTVLISAMVLGVVGMFMDQGGTQQIGGANDEDSDSPESAP